MTATEMTASAAETSAADTSAATELAGLNRQTIDYVGIPKNATEATALQLIGEQATKAVDPDYTVVARKQGTAALSLTIGSRPLTTIRFDVTNKNDASDTASSSSNATVDVTVGAVDEIRNDNFYLNVGELGNIRDMRIENNATTFTRESDGAVSYDASPNFVLPVDEGGRGSNAYHEWMGELIFATRSADTVDGLDSQPFVEQDTNRTLAQGGSTTALNATLGGAMDQYVRRTADENSITTKFIGGPVDGSGPAPTREVGTVMRGFDATSKFSTDTDDGSLLWEVSVENKSDKVIEFGDIGLPMPWNDRYTSTATSYTERVTSQYFAGLDSGYSYAMRPSGEGNFVLMTPVPESGARIEYVDRWLSTFNSSVNTMRGPGNGSASSIRAWTADGTSTSGNAWQPGLEVQYIHSKNIRQLTGAAYSPDYSSLVLEPGASKTYQLKFHAIRAGDNSPTVSPNTTGNGMQEKEENYRSTLYKTGIIDAMAVPSFQPVINMPTKLDLHYDPAKIKDVELQIQTVDENDPWGDELIPAKKGVAPYNLGDPNRVNNDRGPRTTPEGNPGYVKKITPPTAPVVDEKGESHFVYGLEFDAIGPTSIPVTYKLKVGDTWVEKKTQYDFNVLAELDQATDTHSDFMVNERQYNAPENPTLPQDAWDGAFLDTYLHLDGVDDRMTEGTSVSLGQQWDDWGMDNILSITYENVLNPKENQVQAVEKYLLDFLWNNKNPVTGQGYFIRRTSDEYPADGSGYKITNVFNGINGLDWAGAGGRRFTQSMAWNAFLGMYQVEKAYPNLTGYRASRLDYLRMAYSIYVKVGQSDQGTYGEQNTALMIQALLDEGMNVEAQNVINRIAPSDTATSGKGYNSANVRYPYGSEFVYDNTGEEGIYANDKALITYRPDHTLVKSGDAETKLTMVDMATRAKRGWVPTWYHYADPAFIGGNSWWNFQYTASLAGSIMDDYLRYESDANGFTPEQRALAQRLNYGAKLSNFNSINMGQISSRLIGTTSWRYTTYKGSFGSQNVNDGNGGAESGVDGWQARAQYNGWQSYSGEADLGLFGSLMRISTDVVGQDPVFGLFAYGGLVEKNGAVYTVQPRDGFGKRLNFLDETLYVEFLNDRYKEARVTDDASRLEFDLEHMQAGEHESRLTFTSGMKPGGYRVSVDGVPQPDSGFVVGADGTGKVNVRVADKAIGETSLVVLEQDPTATPAAPTVTTSLNTLGLDKAYVKTPFLLEALATYNGTEPVDYSWEIVNAPEGATPAIENDNAALPSIRFSTDVAGDYEAKVTVTVRGSSPAVRTEEALAFTVSDYDVRVDSVTTDPETVSVSQTGSQTFTANVTGQYLDKSEHGTAVTWSLVNADGKAAGTTLSADGVLTVAANEPLEQLTVRATSKQDDSKFDEATVTVVTPVVNAVAVDQPQSAAQGKSRVLSATVNGDNLTDASKTVTWTLVDADGKAAGTTLTAAGGLTVAADETLTSLKVRATSTLNPDVSGEGTIEITAPPAAQDLTRTAVYSAAQGNIARLTADPNVRQQTNTLDTYYNAATGAGIDRPGILTQYSNAGGWDGILRITDGVKNQAAGSAWNNWGSPYGIESNPVYVVLNWGQPMVVSATRAEFVTDAANASGAATAGTQVPGGAYVEYWDGSAWQRITAMHRPAGATDANPIVGGNFVNDAGSGNNDNYAWANRPNWNIAQFDTPVTTTMLRMRLTQRQTGANNNGIGISEWEVFGEKAAASEYTVTYDLNSGTGTAPAQSPIFAGTKFVAASMPADVVAPSGTAFREWNAAADGSGDSYPAGAVVTQPAGNLTLYAQWVTVEALAKAIDDAKALDEKHYLPSSWSTLAPAISAAEAVLQDANSGRADQAAVDAATAALTDVVSALVRHPDWNAATVYNAGGTVTYQGHVYVAQWYTKGQTPGDPNGSWVELGELVPSAGDGVRAWTASGVYNGGDVVAYNGGVYQAKWYSRNQAPGDPNGAWSELGALVPEAGDGIRAWTATTVYNGGEVVAYGDRTWRAQWYSRNSKPAGGNGAWKDLGAY
ncbi:DUF5695 domain-containing protein [Compostimonas suwonensis]|uniref:DUF5695 domain-containing protein n=1 Tax=Compostimonas suwonensis TaxID=1048394 RepID=UPI0012FDD6AB|nr:DUF5695 domain-containing protein [Compostimonas suwonensis]